MEGVFTAVLDFLMSIFLNISVLLIAPLDKFLNFFPSLDIIPTTIETLGNYLGNIPSTIIYITGLSPMLWNLFFTLFIVYILTTPALNLTKKIYNWIR